MKDHLLQTVLAQPVEQRSNLDLTERKGLEPNLSLLENALKQTKTPALPREGWRAAVMRRLEALDWKAVLTDLRPFVERQSDLSVLSKEAIHKLLEPG